MGVACRVDSRKRFRGADARWKNNNVNGRKCCSRGYGSPEFQAFHFAKYRREEMLKLEMVRLQGNPKGVYL